MNLFGMLNDIEKAGLYSRMSIDYLNMDAIFADETERFQICNGGTAILRLRTAAGNVDKAYAVIGGSPFEMKMDFTKGMFDFYSVEYDTPDRDSYYYVINKNGKEYFYNKKGLYKSVDENYNFILAPDTVPGWAKGAVVYQIFVDRFYNGDTSNDVYNNEYAYLGKAAKRIENWRQPVAETDICNFYGGDLKGIKDKLDYLAGLGVEVIYLSPVFVSPSNHKYDIQDYDYVDPHIGVIVDDGGDPLYFEKFHNRYATMYIRRTTNIANLEASNKLMADLIAASHEKGIKVILDGVFNHCGAFNKWLDKAGFYYANNYPLGAYRSASSQYHNYFRWYDSNWPNNDCYDSWWGHDNHPKLNYEESSELYDYILQIGAKWVSAPYNADGWRLDVAADLGYSKELNHRFWKDFRKSVRAANPQAVILAEHYGDPSEWLMGDEWDTIMNYDAFMEPVTWFLTGMEKHSEDYNPHLLCDATAFEKSMRYNMSRLNVHALQSAMNELSNHDHSRFLTRTNNTVGRLHTKGTDAASKGINKGVMLLAVVFQMTWPGAPTIYYGDEAGLCGWSDPDNRRTFPWGNEDSLLMEFHRDIIHLRKRYDTFRTGSLEYLLLEKGVIAFGRFDGYESFVVVINNNPDARRLSLPVWMIQSHADGVFESLMSTSGDSYSMENNEYKADNGYVAVILPGCGSLILKQV